MVLVTQVRAARALLGWSQGDLAREAGVSKPTIARLETDADERGELRGYASTRDRIVTVLSTAGIEFTNEDGIGVRLRGIASA